MIRSTSTDQYVRHADKKQNIPSATNGITEKPKQTKDSGDPLYILELSDPKNQDEQSMSKHYDSAALLDLSQDAREKLSNNIASDARGEEISGSGDDGRPPDETARLTRMLVAAKSTLEVQSVLADTFNHMREWQKLAAEGDKKAIAVVRKLNRLASRGHRKVRDLNKEQLLLQRQQKAEEAEKEQIAQRLRDELKQAELIRKQRERRYLQERDDYNEEEPDEIGPSMAATEAKIRALAAAMAAVSQKSTDVGSTASGDGIATVDAGMASAEMSEGETAEGD